MDQSISPTEPFVLPAVLDLPHAEELSAQLQEAEHLPHVIDASEIGKISTAGLQLMLVLMRTAAERGQTLEIRGGSTLVQEALASLGLDESLPLTPNPDTKE